MSLISKVRGWFTREKSMSGGTLAWDRGDDLNQSAGGLSLSTAELQSVWVYACVQAIAESVANTPFRLSVGTRKGEEIVESGPVFELWNRPHPLTDRYQFWELLIQWLMLRGRACVIGVDKSGGVVDFRASFGGGVPSQLILLDVDRMQRITGQGPDAGWIYRAGFDDIFQTYNFLPGEVINIRLPGIASLWDGQSPLYVAALAAGTDYHAAQYMRGVMANNADTGLVVGTDQKLGEDQRAQMVPLRSFVAAIGAANVVRILAENSQRFLDFVV